MRLARALTLMVVSAAAGCALVLSGTYTSHSDEDAGLPDEAGSPPADAAAERPAPPDDAGDEAKPNPCAPYLFCDDFEELPVDGGPWQSFDIPGHGTATLDTAHACSGAHSLHISAKAGMHITTDSTYQAIFAHDEANLPADVFLRAFVSFDRVPLANPVFVLLGNLKPQGVQEQSQNGVLGGQTYFLVADQAWTDGNGRPIAPSHCACVEIEVDRENSVIRTWLDGTFSSDTTFAAGSIPYLGRFVVGLSFYNATNMFNLDSTDEVYVDLVALDTRRIGCAPVR